MRYKKFLLGVIASMLCLGLLNGCGHEDEISIKIETYLQEEYGEEFEVLSWNQPKLLPSDNGAIYATCISKMTQIIHLRVAILIQKNQTQK